VPWHVSGGGWVRGWRLIVVGVLLLAVPSAASVAAPSISAAAALTQVRAVEPRHPIRTENGHIDIRATLDRVRALHANTYAFLVKTPMDWVVLHKFVRAAQQRRIAVWVYLLAPCKPGTIDHCTPPAAPFGMDYVRWVKAIAQLSRRYPVVRAWTIDDFDHSFWFFTEKMLKTIRGISRPFRPMEPSRNGLVRWVRWDRWAAFVRIVPPGAASKMGRSAS
jgi:hypothetical protein